MLHKNTGSYIFLSINNLYHWSERQLQRLYLLIRTAIKNHTVIALLSYLYQQFQLGNSEAWKQCVVHLADDPRRRQYQEWIWRFNCLTRKDKALMPHRIQALNNTPIISVIIPIYNPPSRWLEAAILSVIKQIYPHWELCLCDDASSHPEIQATIKKFQQQDSRIKTITHSDNKNISSASNSALTLASGEFVVFLDHDDQLAPHALYWIIEALHQQPDAELIYSDEDKIDEISWRYDPYFKPDWNPDLLRCQNYIGHLSAYRKSTIDHVGGFRQGFEGSQDWDLALRVTESIDAATIVHIPHILYHWRAIPGSTAHDLNEKHYAQAASIKALQEHFQRTDTHAEVLTLENGYFCNRYPLPEPEPWVSIIIPTRNQYQLIKTCISSVQNKTDYRHYEIIIIDNQSDNPDTLSYLESIADDTQIRLLRFDAPFNFSAICNDAVPQAKGELILLLNNDIEITSSGWLKEMVSHAVRPEIGLVGAKLLFPDNTVQHAGVVLGLGGVAGHAYLRQNHDHPGQMGRAQLVQNFGAVTGACMMVKKSLYLQLNGFNETDLRIAFNDIDFCLRIRAQGYLIVWTPFAKMLHLESASRGYEDTREKQQRFAQEVSYMQTHWHSQLQHDPTHNPNLSLIYEENPFETLAQPPRVDKPWLAAE